MRTFIQQKSFPEATRYIPGIVGHAILVLPRIPPPFSFSFPWINTPAALFLFPAKKIVAVLRPAVAEGGSSGVPTTDMSCTLVR